MAKKRKSRKKKKSSTGKRSPARKAAPQKKRVRRRRPVAASPAAQVTGARGRRPTLLSAGQSGDLQALHRRHSVDSESVGELLSEGQAFEAEAVSGVENARDPDQGEVRTSEVPEDDVPEEYHDAEKS